MSNEEKKGEGAPEARPGSSPQHAGDLMDALGGVKGIADSSLPALAFVIAYTFNGHDLGMAVWIAVGFGGLIAALRIVRRDPVQYALAGFAGVALAAFVADRTGKAEDFFIPGLLLNAGYATAYTVSILVGWPLLGVFLGPLSGDGMAWREDPEKVRAYTRTSWIWVGLFVVRLAVQLPLYFAGALLALGIAKTAMGVPLFLIACWLSYLILRGPVLHHPNSEPQVEG